MSSESLSMFIQLGNGAHFFLNQAFKHINLALEEDLAEKLFNEEMSKLNPPMIDVAESLQDHQNNPVKFLQSEELFLLDDTTDPVYLAKENSKKAAKDGKNCFTGSHKIESHELLGHITNFSFFIESLVNRHLLFLKFDHRVDSFSYNRLENIGIMGKLIFIMKGNIEKKNVSIEKIHSLFGYRNKTVHFTPKNTKALKISILKLNQIWDESIHLMNYFHSFEQFRFDDFGSAIQGKVNKFENRWIR